MSWQTFDPKMPLTHIWIDFHVGQIQTDDEGGREEKVFSKDRMELIAMDVSDIEQYREELHVLLDETITKLTTLIPDVQKNGIKRSILIPDDDDVEETSRQSAL